MKRWLIAASLLFATAHTVQAADNLKAFPAAEPDMTRHVLQLPMQADESALQVELIVGKTVPADAGNRYFFGGRIEAQNIPSWGYTRYVVTALGPMAGTLMAIDPSAPKVERFISLGGEPYLLRYNSQLPVVVYVPVGAEVRYRIWAAQTPAQSIDADNATLADGTVSAATGFTQNLDLLGIRFQISSTGQGSLSQLTILPSGLSDDNAPLQQEIDGSVTAAAVADLNRDGAPEVYVFVTSAGSGSYASLVAYASNRNRSLSEIHLPPLTDDPALAKGYMGHDQLSLGDGVLQRRFPLYRDGDSNAAPTGGTRQIDYRLVTGKAGWQLQIDRVKDN